MLLNGRVHIRPETIGGAPELLVEFVDKVLV
jgi:hypothetical protein